MPYIVCKLYNSIEDFTSVLVHPLSVHNRLILSIAFLNELLVSQDLRFTGSELENSTNTTLF